MRECLFIKHNISPLTLCNTGSHWQLPGASVLLDDPSPRVLRSARSEDLPPSHAKAAGTFELLVAGEKGWGPRFSRSIFPFGLFSLSSPFLIYSHYYAINVSLFLLHYLPSIIIIPSIAITVASYRLTASLSPSLQTGRGSVEVIAQLLRYSASVFERAVKSSDADIQEAAVYVLANAESLVRSTGGVYLSTAVARAVGLRLAQLLSVSGAASDSDSKAMQYNLSALFTQLHYNDEVSSIALEHLRAALESPRATTAHVCYIAALLNQLLPRWDEQASGAGRAELPAPSVSNKLNRTLLFTSGFVNALISRIAIVLSDGASSEQLPVFRSTVMQLVHTEQFDSTSATMTAELLQPALIRAFEREACVQPISASSAAARDAVLAICGLAPAVVLCSEASRAVVQQLLTEWLSAGASALDAPASALAIKPWLALDALRSVHHTNQEWLLTWLVPLTRSLFESPPNRPSQDRRVFALLTACCDRWRRIPVTPLDQAAHAAAVVDDSRLLTVPTPEPTDAVWIVAHIDRPTRLLWWLVSNAPDTENNGVSAVRVYTLVSGKEMPPLEAVQAADKMMGACAASQQAGHRMQVSWALCFGALLCP